MSILHQLVTLGFLGPLLLGIADSSFLFVPIGNDLLIIILVARHPREYLLYSAMGAIGSTLGVLLLDLVARNLGEAGVKKVTGRRRFKYLERRISTRGGAVAALAALAPPPFPFTAMVAAVSALHYSRTRLLLIIFVSRAIRFLILSYLAIRYGTGILRFLGSSAFRYSAITLGVICVLGSVLTIRKWLQSRG